MILLSITPKEELMEKIPQYFQLVANYINSGRKLPDELNPIHFLSDNIDELSISKQKELLEKIQKKYKELSSIY